MEQLLTSEALDKVLRYPGGRSARMARKGLIPHIRLPDGEIRFDAEQIEAWLGQHSSTASAPDHEDGVRDDG